jgi:hypothetical protein
VAWPTFGESVGTFLCQFDFTDSRDLVPKLPGDILLIFVADAESLVTDEQVSFIWVASDETEVVREADAPSPTQPVPFVQAWGVRHRTVDLPSCWEDARTLAKESAWRLPVLWATKIGGVPYDSQDQHGEPPPGYLCQICSVQTHSNVAWPWVDRRAPLSMGFDSEGIYGQKNQLMFGDMGELTFYLQENGTIDVAAACG